MAQLSGCGAGCGTLLVLVAIGVGLTYWPVFLLLGLLVLIFAVVSASVMEANRKKLKPLVEIADRRVRHEACRVRERFGVVEAISLSADLATPGIDIRCRTIADEYDQLLAQNVQISLSPPADAKQLGVTSGIKRWLDAGGIRLLEDLSVEAKATRAAIQCLREQAWAQEALGKLEGIKVSLADTLTKAEGNELLEASIPQLQKALRTFEAEEEKLQQARQSATEMVRKLHDFLSVPEAIRPILSFDLDQLYDPQRFSELEQSFSEVVLLNDAFRELSRDALA